MKKNNEFASLNYARLDKNLIIGNGRLASHLANYFSLLKIPFSQVYRKKHSQEEMAKLISENDRILIAISDREIENFVKQFYTSGKVWIHFSGALTIENVFSCHPLMSFTEKMFELTVYEQIHFTVSSWKDSQELSLNQIIPFFKNPHSYLNYKQKSLYHSLCVISGNFSVILWTEVLKEFQKMNIPATALESYLENTLNNFKELRERALTGPLQRKDLVTIKKNLNALDENKELQNIYKSFLQLKGVEL